MTEPENLARQIEKLRTEVRLLREAVTEAMDLRRPAPVSTRKAGQLLGVGRDRLSRLIQGGHIRTVPWGTRWRIPRAEIERVARDGLPVPGARRRRRTPRPSPGRCDPDALRKLRIEDL